MSMILIKRIYDSVSAQDGKRILVDRLWPRGVRKDVASLDLWCKEVAPTPPLRVWFDHRADRFHEFKERYKDELRTNSAVSTLLTFIGEHRATLLYAAHDTQVNHAVVLADFLARAREITPMTTKLVSKHTSS
ncbi:DUF488 domain-containing protein [Tardiphaga sp. 862_B3_N4_1]|uniref:DUF488 domain-containing protein n=1 Tax=Tardiphaga sp. 862_B3_N4_1 TaxID=3240764 RepID=UPI003F24A390